MCQAASREYAEFLDRLHPEQGVGENVIITSVSSTYAPITIEKSDCLARVWKCRVRPSDAAGDEECELCLREPCQHTDGKCTRKNFTCRFCHRHQTGSGGCWVSSTDQKRYGATLAAIPSPWTQ
ncbi:unnamed protein product [Symbiodinium natans]|uniref:Uncharacterized protein n=1 Tax=Symbiodinium natans TaxID=878477 RepID=A0A812V4S8_9DINO|nr:unnamed protein product [Symbiodinium natans]